MLITCPFDPDAVVSNDTTFLRDENIYNKIKVDFCICVLFQKRVTLIISYIAAVIIFILSVWYEESRLLHRSRNVTGGINFVLQIVIDDCKLIKHEPPVRPRVSRQICCMDNVHLYGIC